MAKSKTKTTSAAKSKAKATAKKTTRTRRTTITAPVMVPSYTFNPSTGVLTLSNEWGPSKFAKLIIRLGVGSITKIIVTDYARVSMTSMNLKNIFVERQGFLTIAGSFIDVIENYGTVRARKSTITNVHNDGQLYLTGFARCREMENFRHLNLSQSFLYHCKCGEHASIKATSSYLVSCHGDGNTQLCLGPSMVVDGTGSFSYWSRPTLGGVGFNRFINVMQLRILVVDILAQVDAIDSNYVYTDPNLQKKVAEAALLLDAGALLESKLAKEFASRITLPYAIPQGKKMVSFNSTKAMDNLHRCVGNHI